MSRICPYHGTELHETQRLFPGSPCEAEMWCLAYAGGHAARRWVTPRSSTVHSQPATRKPSSARKPRRPGPGHPWRIA